MEINEKDPLAGLSANEIDPRLRFDAFTAGIKNGGLRSVTSIYLLVCYIVARVEGKVTAQNIIETMAEGMIANHFEISNAISNLIKNGTISEAEDGALSLSVKHPEAIDLIEHDLPLTIRKSSIEICQKIMAREMYKRENKIEIEEKNGDFFITMYVSGDNLDYMKLTLYAPSREQAEVIKEKFINNPVNVYNSLIDGIFKN